MAIKSTPGQTITEAPPKKGNAITPGKSLESSNEGKRQLTRNLANVSKYVSNGHENGPRRVLRGPFYLVAGTCDL